MRRILKYFAVGVLGLVVCLGDFVPVHAAGVITVSPTSGSVGSSVTLSGSGYTVGETVIVNFDSTQVISGYPVTSATWSFPFSVPASTSGNHIVTAIGSFIGTTSTNFTVIPKITASQTNGTGIVVHGTGFASNENVAISIDNSQVGFTIASTKGSWDCPISSVAAGNRVITTSGSYGSNTYILFNVISFSTIALSQTSGPAGISVTINGNDFAPNETGITVTFDGNRVGSTQAGSTGNWVLTLVVPAASSGPHIVAAYGTRTPGSTVPTRTFTITPGFMLNKSSASPGTTVTATGSGFVSGETGINVTYDGNPIGTPSRADSKGLWASTFVIPPGQAGTHTVGAYGANTPANMIPTFIFKVSAVISISKTSGAAGTLVAINGEGFGPNETGVTVTYDGSALGPSITASANGSWTTSFVIPPSPAKAHIIAASGSTTPAASVPIVTFTSTAGVVNLSNNTAGTVGTSITLSGFGFAAVEKITITYDGSPVETASAESTGEWTATFSVPPSSAGFHTIGVNAPKTSNTGNLGFKVTPSISADSLAGYIGDSVKLKGSGFASNSILQITYDDSTFNNLGTVRTDSAGSFNQTIIIPISKTGRHTLKVQDAQSDSSNTSLDVKAFDLSTPKPIYPPDGSKIGLTGDVTLDFRWSSVTSPDGGITYSLQIDTNSNFPHPFFEKTGLTATHYTLYKLESLSEGNYYWRIRAIDDASNQSEWSPSSSLQSGRISSSTLTILIIIMGCLVLAALIILMFRLILSRRKAEEARELALERAQVPEIVIQGISTPEYLAIGPGDTGQNSTVRALPWRLALPQPPQPARGVLALPPGDQARLKVIIDFTTSLPLVEPEQSPNWLIELAENGNEEVPLTVLYSKLLKSEIAVHYEPSWIQHPIFVDLQNLLQGQPVLEDLTSFIGNVNQTSSRCILLLQDIYQDIINEEGRDVLDIGGWGFISGVYTDSVSWYMAKYLRDPSERDYSIKLEGQTEEKKGTFDLYGEQNTPFAGLLVRAPVEKEAMLLRAIHLKLRSAYRNNEKTIEVVDAINQLEVQRSGLIKAFSQLAQLSPSQYA